MNSGSCNLINSYPLEGVLLKSTSLRPNKDNDENKKSHHYFLIQGSVYAIELLMETVCFAVVTSEEDTSHVEVKDNCGIIIQTGESFLKRKY